ncbi:PilT/PilU family type 4a pilus ATPase [Acinetobacter johnsonii]|jgi:twitching motility protein PilU|uniref:PilT/PilU family type 4a pilus ATPase n=1 Tax=Acinetobacter johnsonii TaxID=40214 RepID=A0AA42U7L6_ACIJO|nr:PilT/PilU family type 4a pilus ATPase [Acinetobacter johnsonii]MDN5691138.1 PilT/PilU family type 4a pilus ATPase [Acinetobacter sp.]MDH1363993.1 PilT/PilU family type 4a pilus ATPase [Acinetobacter johnsonii]MDH1438532.1 PilT/PilU family type 4a pilus ATPase [Acinetobacter johnsonii]MDH1698816.1 PilT/PilU family type 4a pilus ATPase [Acinetobacter johnsonii]UJA01027.1 PilT/PilU family type 4a pilus ATPase [Acinetobacter johnsonii]
MYSAELLEEARRMMFHMLSKVVEYGGSDLFISADFPPSIKHQGLMKPLGQQNLPSDQTKLFAYSLMNEKQRLEFETELECNFAISVPNVSRFRVNVFQQQLHVGMVIRTITAEIPNFTKLQLPTSLKDVIMEKRGLVLVVGGTGSGKSTSLAAMIDHRNENSAGHIITVEDPVEYVHKHKKSMITHREVGVDCHSWHNALKNTLRQAPDVILIGEIRDTETMEHAIAFAETGHLCLGTLHANNANQALDRIINFFPDERRNQLLMDLSSNMKAIISQRLVRTEDGRGRRAAVEIMLNTPLMSDLILKGNFHELKEVMSKSRELGMQTFDQALFDLYNQGAIAYEEALRNADSVNELRLQIKLKSSRANPQLSSNSALSFDQAIAEKAKDAEEEKADA